MLLRLEHQHCKVTWVLNIDMVRAQMSLYLSAEDKYFESRVALLSAGFVLRQS